MPALDAERLEVARIVRDALAIQNQLSRRQARAYVRCLQTMWQVPTIMWGEQESLILLADARRLLHAAHIFRQVEGISSLGATDCYRRSGEILEWLTRSSDSINTVVPIELLAAAAYQLGGLPAMAAGLLGQVNSENSGIGLYAAFLKADFDGVLSRCVAFWRENPELTEQNASYRLASTGVDDEDDNVIAWYFSVELVRCLGLIASSLRSGDNERLERAMLKLGALDDMSFRTFSADASLIVSLIRQVAEGFKASSIYRPLLALSELNPSRRDKLLVYARDQYSRGRGILWTSQLHGLDKLINGSSFALCTPTGSGKTLVANMALIKELLLREFVDQAPLAIYLVPSRALAGEVESKLRSELGGEMTITALYGGADWGITDYWLTSDQPTVLIATVEKAETMMRYFGPLLLARLKLLIIDEAHQIVPEDNENTRISFSEHSNRSVRLENLVARIRTHRPDVVRIALTAVAGGASGPVARWIEGRSDAEAVGVRYRSTRQVLGVLETAQSTRGRIELEIMNGKPLFVRGQEEPVFLTLKMPAMPLLPPKMRNSLNRFNCLSVLWTSLHLVEEDQRILISVTQEPEKTMRWFVEAIQLVAWADVPAIIIPEGILRARFEEARSVCIDYCGKDSYELFLLEHGIATSHGQMPQRLRRLMVEMIERRICPITVATATLTEGVNLPFDLIFLTSLKRRSWDSENEKQVIIPLSISEFRNLAGRAGRPGAAKGIEGMTLIALPSNISTTAAGQKATQHKQRQELFQDYVALRSALLVDEIESDEVESPLALLLTAIRDRALELGVSSVDFLKWLEQALPEDVSKKVGECSTEPNARLADALDELDGILLTALEEIGRAEDMEITGPRAEAHLVELWSATFSSVAAVQEAWLEQAFVHRGQAVIETFYPDPDERRRLYQYGFSPVVGRKFETVAPHIHQIMAEAIHYGEADTSARLSVFEAIGNLLRDNPGFGFRVRATDTDQHLLDKWTDVLAWWMHQPQATHPAAESLRTWQRFVADNLEFRLGLVISAVVAQAWSSGADDPMAIPTLSDWKGTTGLPWFGFWAKELLKWGTHDPFVAFALSQSLASTREAASQRRNEFEAWLRAEYVEIEAEDLIDPQYFLEWEASLPRRGHSSITDDPETAELTGSDGRHRVYKVIPVTSGNVVRWLDPAGFELARSERGAHEHGNRDVRNDYELRKGRRGSIVHKIFTA